jgi:uncharacterized protein (DUF736 family)
MSQQRDNTGALFKNDFKTEDKHPLYKGKCMVNGVEMEIAAWLKEGREGKKFMSLSFSQPRERTQAPPKQEARVGNGPDLDDDIPFNYK